MNAELSQTVDPLDSGALAQWANELGVIRSGDESSAEVRGEIIKICKSGDTVGVKNAAIAAAVVAALNKQGHFYYDEIQHDFATAMYFDSTVRVLHRIGSDAFRSWLSDWIAINRSDPSFKFVVTAVEDAALTGDKTLGITPENYWASREGAVYLSNGDGNVIKITSTGFEKVDNGTDGVLFSCGRTLIEWDLVDPVDPFQSCDLFRTMNCSAPHGKDLFRGWVMSVPTNPKCKPPLALTGDVGSGKTRAASGIAELYGIPRNVIKATGKETGEGQFWTAVNQGGLVVVDNVDSKIKWLPDTLAACSTNGTEIRRKLYRDTDTVTVRSLAWLAVTSANPEFASDAGLADRLLAVRLKRRTGTTSDAVLSEQIAANRSAGISFIVHALQKALADDGPVPEDLNARHPDFAAQAVRIGRAIGREREVILALRAAESDKAVLCLENDPFGAAIAAIIAENHEVEGTAAEIVARVTAQDTTASRGMTSLKGSKRLTSLWPHLEAVYETNKKTIHGGSLWYRVVERGWAKPAGDAGDDKEAISSKPS